MHILRWSEHDMAIFENVCLYICMYVCDMGKLKLKIIARIFIANDPGPILGLGTFSLCWLSAKLAM